MAHFAFLDENNVVTQVIVIRNEDMLEDGVESEAKGIAYCKSLFGENIRIVQTSYNNNFRKRYAYIGGTYDPQRDIFINPQPFPSWGLNPDTTEWEAPIPCPEDNKVYVWRESEQIWVAVGIKPDTEGVPI